MRPSPLSRSWPALLAAAFLLALTWLSSTVRVSSQELVPRVSAEECPEPLSGYAEDELGHRDHLQTLACVYHKVQAGDAPLRTPKTCGLPTIARQNRLLKR